MPDGTASAHLYRPKLATVLTEGYGVPPISCKSIDTVVRLKRLVADLSLEKQVLKDIASGNL